MEKHATSVFGRVAAGVRQSSSRRAPRRPALRRAPDYRVARRPSLGTSQRRSARAAARRRPRRRRRRAAGRPPRPPRAAARRASVTRRARRRQVLRVSRAAAAAPGTSRAPSTHPRSAARCPASHVATGTAFQRPWRASPRRPRRAHRTCPPSGAARGADAHDRPPGTRLATAALPALVAHLGIGSMRTTAASGRNSTLSPADPIRAPAAGSRPKSSSCRLNPTFERAANGARPAARAARAVASFSASPPAARAGRRPSS